MTQHTPGQVFDEGGRISVRLDGHEIEVAGTVSLNGADHTYFLGLAFLLAAAPDLLDALKLALPILEAANAECTNETAFIRFIRAAIAKAEGQS